MTATRIGLFSLVLSTILYATVFCADMARAEETVSPKHAAEIEHHSRRLMTVIELVLDHHIEPPTRQEMLVAALRNLCDTAKQPVPQDLSRRVSDLTTRQEIETLLREYWQRANPTNDSIEHLSAVAIEGVFNVVPGESDLIKSKELKVQEQLQANRYVGIGIALGMDSEKKHPKIMGTFPKGPADRGGAVKDDLITRIDGIETADLALENVIERLRGPEGTNVTIHVRSRADAPERELKMTRGVVPRQTIRVYDGDAGKNRNYRPDAGQPIGLVKLNELTASTLHELRQIEPELRAKGILALVLDLRDVRGQGATAAAHHDALLLADGFLDGGMLGTLRTAAGRQTFQADRECAFRGWPIAVLVNERTSGAAEWLAAALQHNQRAVVIGRQTAGHGYVATSVSVPGEDLSLVLSTGIIEYPNGARFSGPRMTASQTLRIATEDSSRPRRLGGGVRPDREIPPTVRSETSEFVFSNGTLLSGEQLGPAWAKAVEILRAKLPNNAASTSQDKGTAND